MLHRTSVSLTQPNPNPTLALTLLLRGMLHRHSSPDPNPNPYPMLNLNIFRRGGVLHRFESRPRAKSASSRCRARRTSAPGRPTLRPTRPPTRSASSGQITASATPVSRSMPAPTAKRIRINSFLARTTFWRGRTRWYRRSPGAQPPSAWPKSEDTRFR